MLLRCRTSENTHSTTLVNKPYSTPQPRIEGCVRACPCVCFSLQALPRMLLVRCTTISFLWWMVSFLYAAAGEESRGGPARVLIVDDQPLYRLALEQLIARQPDLEVAAEAQDGQQAIECCHTSRPDVVLMDIGIPPGMSGMDGLEATRTIKQVLPRTVVLILTTREDVSRLGQALKAGASGYILKTASSEQILDSLRKALEGATPLDHALATGLLLRLLNNEHHGTLGGPAPPRTTGAAQAEAPLAALLTPRELEVLGLVARGYTNREIARSLSVSKSTVKKHVQRLMWKLEVSTRTQAAVKANDLGLLGGREEG
jgi:DNA-binding NarL/FixJ family response regulator